MRVAIVHDDLVQWGGAERVLVGICELFPEAPIYTLAYDRGNKNLVERFGNKKIITSFIERIPFWKVLFKALLPLHGIAFEQFDFSQYDLVISQTTRFAKGIITKPETIHVCYCHTPPRFLWNFSGEKRFKNLSLYFKFLRRYDLVASHRVDRFLAGSENAEKRIKEVYGVESVALHPFVDFNTKEVSFDGGYYLIIARLNKYKRVDIAVRAFNKNGRRLKVVGEGPEFGKLRRLAKDNVEFLGVVPDELLTNLLAGCKALIVCGEEDFGLTSLEAQYFGKPVIAFGEGGARESVIEGKTGVFFDRQNQGSLQEGIARLENLKIDPQDCKKQAKRFSKEEFKKKLLSNLTLAAKS